MEVDGLIYKIERFKDGYQAILVQNINTTATNVSIPDCIQYEGELIPVRRIDKQCFSTQKIKSVIVGHNVVRIDNECFKDCCSLENITFRYIEKPKKTIFNNKQNIIAPPSIDYYNRDDYLNKGDYFNPYTHSIEYPESLRSIGEKTFYGCKSLKEIKLPKEVDSIGDSCFEYCENLERISLPPQMYSIGKNAFSYCKSLREIEIPEKITELKTNTFYLCTSLERVKLNKDLKVLSSDVFYHCDALESITIPDEVYIIRSGCFKYCKALKKIVLPPKLSYLGHHAFYGNESLLKVIIENPKIEFDLDCFSGCKSLTDIVFPAKEIKIYDTCVDDCPNLSQNTLMHVQETESGKKRIYERSFSFKFKKYFKKLGAGFLTILGAIIVLPIIGIGYLLVMGIGSYIGMIITLVVYVGVLAYIIGLCIMYLLGKLFKFEQKFDTVYNIACVALGGLVIGLYYLITN